MALSTYLSSAVAGPDYIYVYLELKREFKRSKGAGGEKWVIPCIIMNSPRKISLVCIPLYYKPQNFTLSLPKFGLLGFNASATARVISRR